MRSLFLLILVSSTTTLARLITKREYVDKGVTYIEELSSDEKGITSTLSYPKPGQGKQVTTTTVDASKNIKTTTKIDEPGLKVNISVTQSPQEAETASKLMGELSFALIDCKKFEGSMPHPLVPKETLKVKVLGIVDGKCKMTETMPNNGLLTCLLTEQQRKEFKKNPTEILSKFMTDENICKITGY